MSGIMGSSLDEDDDYDSWKHQEHIKSRMVYLLFERIKCKGDSCWCDVTTAKEFYCSELVNQSVKKIIASLWLRFYRNLYYLVHVL